MGKIIEIQFTYLSNSIASEASSELLCELASLLVFFPLLDLDFDFEEEATGDLKSGSTALEVEGIGDLSLKQK